ncbi:hypothetical protein A4U49_12480 [Acidithiobacillus ferrivorans]|uniref:conjugative transfer signal peptidase TraF n=1 Tax=Acidithiobacillus ferrivorans TaxID=160808 RepID=UPI000893CEBA|nr:conjugative transfer signal peptidase TraF [Acidithiobacillus ferrivorans]OFA15479.1 hypothetical protein A4U49_12480 [Acidithiobacillus ferrivorans]
MSSARNRFLGWGAPLLAVIIFVAWTAPHIMYNFTPSMPVGFYWIWRPHGSIKAGDVVLACVPLDTPAAREGLRRHYLPTQQFGALRCPGDVYPVVKPVAAVPGDTVTLSLAGVAVDHRLLPNTAIIQADPQDRPVRHMPLGAYRVPASTFWLISGFNRLSFDSRYWGPVPRADILRLAVPFLTFPWHPSKGAIHAD